ncbi:MAG: sugar phosphate isomerase/epimerase, partial [Acidimicrobiia bacterium]|nr:sugar phosphate isomerase/epimerase [Acidimicrobiia bacterium]
MTDSRLLSIAAGVHPELAPADMVTTAAAAGWPACGIWFDGNTWTDATSREVRRRLD